MPSSEEGIGEELIGADASPTASPTAVDAASSNGAEGSLLAGTDDAHGAGCAEVGARGAGGTPVTEPRRRSRGGGRRSRGGGRRRGRHRRGHEPAAFAGLDTLRPEIPCLACNVTDSGCPCRTAEVQASRGGLLHALPGAADGARGGLSGRSRQLGEAHRTAWYHLYRSNERDRTQSGPRSSSCVGVRVHVTSHSLLKPYGV